MGLGDAIRAALSQAWPPFVLVAGLLTIGAVADTDGVFEVAAGAITRASRQPMVVLCGLLGLTAVTSALLNLDTAAAFLTPVLILAARELNTDEQPFLYGAVLMANAGSLFFVGSNLTNLLVIGGRGSGGAFFVQMLPAASVSVVVTGAGVLGWAWCRHRANRVVRDSSPARSSANRGTLRLGPGLFAIPIAAVLILAIRQPSLPVAALGVIAATLAIRRETVSVTALRRAVGPLSLLGLLGVAVLLGTLGREWSGPSRLLGTAGIWTTAGLAAAADVLINNLPAATLLSAHAPAHAHALLVGLDLGPNLAVTGSLAVLIWWRGARRLHSPVSVRRYSLIGAPLAMVAGIAALAVLNLTS